MDRKTGEWWLRQYGHCYASRYLEGLSDENIRAAVETVAKKRAVKKR